MVSTTAGITSRIGRLSLAGRSPCCRAGSAASSASVHPLPSLQRHEKFNHLKAKA
jgi:hypothetical protein